MHTPKVHYLVNLLWLSFQFVCVCEREQRREGKGEERKGLYYDYCSVTCFKFHLFNKCLLKSRFVQGTVLVAGRMKNKHPRPLFTWNYPVKCHDHFFHVYVCMISTSFVIDAWYFSLPGTEIYYYWWLCRLFPIYLDYKQHCDEFVCIHLWEMISLVIFPKEELLGQKWCTF